MCAAGMIVLSFIDPWQIAHLCLSAILGCPLSLRAKSLLPINRHATIRSELICSFVIAWSVEDERLSWSAASVWPPPGSDRNYLLQIAFSVHGLPSHSRRQVLRCSRPPVAMFKPEALGKATSEFSQRSDACSKTKGPRGS